MYIRFAYGTLLVFDHTMWPDCVVHVLRKDAISYKKSKGVMGKGSVNEKPPNDESFGWLMWWDLESQWQLPPFGKWHSA